MKKIIFFIMLIFVLVCGLNAQVHNQGTIALITINPAADPLLCIFGNTIDDVILITSLINIKQEVGTLRQREEISLHENITREAQRLNARFISLYIVQRELIERDGRREINVYFIVNIYERTGNRYFLVATNDY